MIKKNQNIRISIIMGKFSFWNNINPQKEYYRKNILNYVLFKLYFKQKINSMFS